MVLKSSAKAGGFCLFNNYRACMRNMRAQQSQCDHMKGSRDVRAFSECQPQVTRGIAECLREKCGS